MAKTAALRFAKTRRHLSASCVVSAWATFRKRSFCSRKKRINLIERERELESETAEDPLERPRETKGLTNSFSPGVQWKSAVLS